MLAVNQLVGFGVRRRAAAGGGYSFTMTAGTNSGFSGYDTNYLIGIFGSIDVEPFPGNALQALLADGSTGLVSFVGDITALVAGLQIWVGGVAYPFDSADWEYTGPGNNETYAEWATAAPTFSGSQLIEIK